MLLAKFVDEAGIRHADGDDDRAPADIGAGDGADVLHKGSFDLCT